MARPVPAFLVLEMSPTRSVKEIGAHRGQQTITRVQSSLTGKHQDTRVGYCRSRRDRARQEFVHPLYLTQHSSGLFENIHQYVSIRVRKVYAVRFFSYVRDFWDQKISKSARFHIESNRINLILIRSTQHPGPS